MYYSSLLTAKPDHAARKTRMLWIVARRVKVTVNDHKVTQFKWEMLHIRVVYYTFSTTAKFL